MALVDDDQVEVVGRVVAEDAEAVAGVGERLVEREVDLAPGLDVALDLPDRVAEDRLGTRRLIGWSTRMLRSAR